MRTPWRFVADLVSRKPNSNRPDEIHKVAPETIALEYKPVADEAQPDIEAAADITAEPGSKAQVEASLLQPDIGPIDAETAEAVTEEAPAVAAGIVQSATLPISPQPEERTAAPTQTEAAEALPKLAPTRRKKAEPIVEAVASIGATAKVAPTVATAPKSFVDEMAELDAEVDELRRQLAKKLIEQNAQLRKMLARFEAP